MMKVSRSIRKEWGGAILIAFVAVMLAVCISPALASATYVPPDPTNLANTTGRYWVNYTWQAGSGWHLIAGAGDGGFYGYNWTGSAWQSDSAIASGLPDVGNYSAPTVFQKDEAWYLIAGEVDGGFHGYNWTGSAWQSDSAIASGLLDVGNYSAPTVFQKDEAYLIAGAEDGGFYGYNWTCPAWQNDSAIASGLPDADLPDAEDHSTPTVFRKDEAWYLIAGGRDAFHGYNWTGSAWQSDSAIASGLPDAGNYSAPTVFQKDGGWYLIAGAGNGRFYGYNWTGSAWQSDSAIASGLLDVGDNSTLAVFDMGRPEELDSTFGLVGSVPTGGGGTYPPGWFETPTPAVTATKSPTPSTTATATVAPPDDTVTPAPTKAKPAAAKATTPAAEGTTAGDAKKDAPGFAAVFVITGMLAAVYVMMRRRG